MRIEVYTKEHCPNCETVKRYLDRRGVKYVERDAAAPASRALLRGLGISAADDRAVAVAATTLIAALDDASAPGEPDTDTEDTEATDEDEEADDEEA